MTTTPSVSAPGAERDEPSDVTETEGEAAPSVSPTRPSPSGRSRRRGIPTAICSVLLALVVAGHRRIPDAPGHVGSLVETLLPWTALVIVALSMTALLRRSRTAAVALVLPIVAWTAVFGGSLTDRSSPGGDLTVVSHNVNQDNADPSGTARSLIAHRAEVLALEELSPDTAPVYERALAASYPYHYYDGTVGLWSVHPLRDTRVVPIMPWTRAVRATVDTPEGRLAVYVVHLPSVRVGPTGFTTGARNRALGLLAADLRAERARHVVVMGDFNGSTGDRALRPLTARMASAQSTAGKGFGFTWPARLPVVRIDQILLRGAKATSAWTLPATASDHLPVAARIDLTTDTPDSGDERRTAGRPR
ncbi:endonuclease/exonuclease/phosphatase family protein [Streptomyces sp. MSC1_001]|jgi:vancomycin resistance protein VanJ|uniref:endonuclease/exonuclease/phosphatase family protein n=1 Tax=Streptomyces sp. MSC1_001 TaxID=2909263 RepID=UPI0035B2AA79